MKFLTHEPLKNQNFSLIYRENEYSFDIDPFDVKQFEGIGGYSILIDFLQLEIEDNGTVIYVWGYCPLIIYEETNNFPQGYEAKSLIAQLLEPPISGISYRLNEDKPWPIFINKKMGWVCLGNPKTENMQLVEFAPSCVATLDEQELVAVWLHPKYV